MNRPDLDHVDWTHHVLVDKYEDLISFYLNKGKCDFWTEQKTDVLVSLQLSITPFDFYLRSVHLHLDEISHLTGVWPFTPDAPDGLFFTDPSGKEQLQTVWGKKKSGAFKKYFADDRMIYPSIITCNETVGSPWRLESTLPCFQT